MTSLVLFMLLEEAESSGSPIVEVLSFLAAIGIIILLALGKAKTEEAEQRRRYSDPIYGVGSLRGKIKSLTAKGKKMSAEDRKKVEQYEVELARHEQRLSAHNRGTVNVSQTVNVAGRDVKVEAAPEKHSPCEFCGCTLRDDNGRCPGCGAAPTSPS